MNQFKHYLRKEVSGVYHYYLVSGGTVTTTTTKTPLLFSPEGWKEKDLLYARGFEYWGVISRMSNPFKFVIDGAKILKHIYVNEGVQGDCEHFIERLNDTSQLYEDYYFARVDFAKILIEPDHVTANAMDTVYMENLKARESTNYEIDLDTHPNFFYIRMDGITLRNNIEYRTDPEFRVNNNGPTTIGITRLFEESQIGIENFKSAVPATSYSGSAALQGDYKASHINNQDQSMDISLSWDFWFTLYPLQGLNYSISQFSVVIIHTDSSGTTLGTHLAYPATFFNTISGVSQNATGSTTFTLATGDKLHLVANITGAAGYGISYSFGEYNIQAEFRLAETYIKALRPSVVFNELVDNISDNTVNKSALPLVDYNKFALTSGDGIRGLSGSKLKTNFIDFFKSYNLHAGDNGNGLATYYDKATNTHYIVDKGDVFDAATLAYDVGDVAEFKYYPLEDLLYSSIKTGGKDYKYDELNGKDEFNCEFEFTTPITTVKNELEMLTPYRTDMYGIEFTRSNLIKKESTDNEADNEIFIIETEGAPAGTHLGVDYYDIYRDPAMVINGLLFPDTAFNINLSPKRMILNQGNLFRSMFYPLAAEYIKFQTASKNAEMDTTLGPVVVDEDADVLISDLGSPIFYPVVFEFRCKQPVNIQSILDADPYGKIAFTWDGNAYEGFILESSEKPATRSSQVIKLLATPNNDLTKLI